MSISPAVMVNVSPMTVGAVVDGAAPLLVSVSVPLVEMLAWSP
jgi:hypothetical protein